MRQIRLGTRGSQLAIIQSQLVARRLREAGLDVELVPIVTEGDVRPVDMSPGEGVFVAAIARSLLEGSIDIGVHSAKDVPLEEEAGLVIDHPRGTRRVYQLHAQGVEAVQAYLAEVWGDVATRFRLESDRYVA